MNCSNVDQNQNSLSSSDRMSVAVNDQAQSANSTWSDWKMEAEDSDAKTQSNSKWKYFFVFNAHKHVI